MSNIKELKFYPIDFRPSSLNYLDSGESYFFLFDLNYDTYSYELEKNHVLR